MARLNWGGKELLDSLERHLINEILFIVLVYDKELTPETKAWFDEVQQEEEDDD